METKTIKIIGIIILILIGSLTMGYFFLSPNSGSEDNNHSEDNNESYTTVSYNITIDTQVNESYTIYLPVPIHPGENESVNRIIDNLTIVGEVDYSVIVTNSPMGSQKALKVEGLGPGKLKFNKTFPQNTPEQREKYRPYQIVDLSLLYNNRRDCYMYCEENDSVNMTFKTYYLSVHGEEKWKCYWRADGEIKLQKNWNKVDLIHHCDGDA